MLNLPKIGVKLSYESQFYVFKTVIYRVKTAKIRPKNHLKTQISVKGVRKNPSPPPKIGVFS